MKRAIWVVAAMAVFFFRTGLAAAQGDTQGASLRGAVIDATGAPVPGADVVVFRQGTTIAHVSSDHRGEFFFAGPSTDYQVLVRAQGFVALRSGPVPFMQGSLSHFTLEASGSSGDGGSVVNQRLIAGAPPLTAESSERVAARQVTGATPWEYGVLAQGGFGTNDRSDFRFFLLGGHAGKVLTPNLGSGVLKGNFEYAVEVFPLWQSYTPRFQKVSCTGAIPVTSGAPGCSAPYTVGGTYTGVSITPIMLRWNLTHGQRWVPWLQGAGGVVWTNHKYPAVGNTNPADIASNGPSGDTSVWNFTPQFGIGAHYFLKPRRSLDVSANAVHISSASLGDKNPGVNASVQLSIGYTWWK